MLHLNQNNNSEENPSENPSIKIDKIFSQPNFELGDANISYEFVRDVCIYLSHNIQNDLFGYYHFNYIDFADKMGYSQANLRRKLNLKYPILFDKNSELSAYFNNYIGYTLFLLGERGISISTSSKSAKATEHWRNDSLSVKFIHILEELTVVKEKNNKIRYLFKVTDKFIENLHSTFFKIDINYYSYLKKKKSKDNFEQNLYLYLMNLRNTITANKALAGNLNDVTISDKIKFDQLKKLCCLNNKDESKNKTKIKKAFDELFEKTKCSIDFGLSPNKNYYYEPVLTFHDLKIDTIQFNNEFKAYSRQRELFISMVYKKLWENYAGKIGFNDYTEKKKENALKRFDKYCQDKTKDANFKSQIFVECWNKYMIFNKNIPPINVNDYRAMTFVELGTIKFN